MVFNNNLLLGAGGQGGTATFDPTTIGNSVWLDGSADDLDRSTTSHSSTEMVVAGWFQLNKIDTGSYGILTIGTGSSGSNQAGVYLSSSALQLYCNGYAAVTTRLFRDIGWYHILASFKLDESMAPDKGRLFINGEEITIFSSDGRSSWGTSFNSTATQYVGSISTGNFFNGYIAQPIMLDGQSIQAGDVAITDFVDTFTFGTNGSQAIPKKNSNIAALASTAGGNSFCLDFANSSDLGNDISSNNNDLTPNSMSAANQSENTPSLVYPVVNALRPAISGKTFSEGNLKVSSTSAFGQGNVLTTFPLSKGAKWYWEVIDAAASANQTYGIAKADAAANASGLGGDTKAWGFYNNQYRHNGNIGAVPDSPTNTGTRYMFAVDVDAGKFWMGNDGTWWKPVGGSTAGDPAAGTNPAFTDTDIAEGDTFPAIDLWSSDSATFVFDEDDFAHTIPTGFNYLNSSNLTAPEYQGIDYFDATLYEGNGNGQRVGDFVPFTDAYTVTNSVMFEDGDSRSLTLNSSATRTSATVAAFSLWTKRGALGINGRPLTVQVDGNNYFSIYYNTSDQLDFTINNGGATILQRITTRAFKDTSAWHNIVVIINQGESTQADRVKVFYDGVQISNDSTGFGTNTCTLDGSSALNFLDSASAVHDVGGGSSTGFTQAYDGYVAEVAFLDGADSGGKLNASDFGQVDTSTNRWTPKDIGSYNFGNTGYYLEFKVAPGTSNGAGTDTSGESNNFTSNGSWATSDQFIDCPSQNFATIDPVISNGATPVTLSEGNLTGVRSSSGFQQAYSNFGGFRLQENTGIYFAEVLVGSDTASFNIGVLSGDPPSSTNRYIGQDFGTYGYDNGSGNKVNNSTGAAGGQYAAYGATYTAGDVIGIEIDTNTGSLNFHKNGSDQGQAFTGVPGPYSFAIASESGGGPLTFNFGQQMVLGGASTTLNATAGGRFKHTPPTGAKALNQDNLDNTASKITAWAWIKNRDADDDHVLVDRIRGTGKVWESNTSTTAFTNQNTVQRFLQRGVQVGSDVTVNTANESYVLWQWLLGDSATTGSTTSPAGTIASTTIVADTGHFSVGSYTGNGTDNSTVGHGLGGIPEMIIVRNLSRSTFGLVWHTDGGGATHTADFAVAATFSANSQKFGGSDASNPTANVFKIGDHNEINANTESFVFYALRSIAGVCKVGSYVGNSSSSGPYVSTGFTPKFVMIKNLTTATRNWCILDTARTPNNVTSPFVLLANKNDDDEAGTIGEFDMLSDGFKLRADSANANNSGDTYIYMAMADIGGNGTLPPIYGR